MVLRGFGHGTVKRTRPLWQRAWLDAYPSDVPSSLHYPQLPLSSLLETAAQRFPQRAACTLYGRRTSYSQLVEQARRVATSLAALGAAPGQRVGMLLPNIPEYLIALQATWLTGATALQLSPLMVGEELAKWIDMTQCRTVVTLDLLAPTLMDLVGRTSLQHVIVTSLAERMAPWRGWLYRVERLRRNGPLRLREDAHVHRFDSLLHATPRNLAVKIDPEEDVAVLAPTGGTTASPKAVMLTHRNLLANATQLHAWSRGEDGTEGTLGVLPFFHAYGLTVCVLMSLTMGATIHLYPRFETKPVLELLEAEHVELVPAVPAMVAAFNRELKEQPRDLAFIRAVISGASAFDMKVRQAFGSYGARNIVEGYGLSEASPVTHVNPVSNDNHPGSIGLPLPDTDARIMDQATGLEELPDGAVGELVVRGPQVMKGYFKNSEETARALRGGWLYTGDLARRDRDGYFTIVDRKKDIIKTSGFLVYPAEVEEVLNKFPGVAEAAVIGVPDPERGENIMAIIVPRPGVTLDKAALESHCEAHLGKQKRPRQIEIVSELPKNFLGKIQRRRLRESHDGKHTSEPARP
ncbi:MAG TPA: AMP-binding protein [Gemmataceae bacterium]|jgi:long-chain acyl-CoA synthetase|nr:AMP-binding protein [Gemmataceae bacterium]